MKYYQHEDKTYFAEPEIYYGDDVRLVAEFRIDVIAGVPCFVPWVDNSGCYNNAVKLKLKRCGNLQYCDLCFKKIRERKETWKNFDRKECVACYTHPFRDESRYNRFYRYKGRVNQLG